MSRARAPLSPGDVARARRDPRYRQARQARPQTTQWRLEGLCTRMDPEVFFPAPTEDPGAALEVCTRCPVTAPCLAAALDSGEPDGVWGGTTPEERRAMRQAWVAASG